VLGFPANDFGNQEPGSAEDIDQFCKVNYGVSLPLFAKAPVSGEDKQPLYAALTAAEPVKQGPVEEFREKLKGYGIAANEDPEVLWNFEKFLIGRDGQVVGRFARLWLPMMRCWSAPFRNSSPKQTERPCQRRAAKAECWVRESASVEIMAANRQNIVLLSVGSEGRRSQHAPLWETWVARIGAAAMGSPIAAPVGRFKSCRPIERSMGSRLVIRSAMTWMISPSFCSAPARRSSRPT
jgi:hypothetical protein